MPTAVVEREVLAPDGADLLTLTMLIVHTEVDGVPADELVVELVPAGWDSPRLCTQASLIVQSAIDPQLETWTSGPLQDNGISHWTVLTDEAMLAARAVTAAGEVGSDARVESANERSLAVLTDASSQARGTPREADCTALALIGEPRNCVAARMP